MGNFGLAPPTDPVMTGGLADALFETASRDPDLPQLAHRDTASPGTWTRVSAARTRDEVVELAKGLIVSGVRPGNRVAVMARTRYEWTVLALALWAVGAEIVPIHPTSSSDRIEWILRDSACVGVVVEDEPGVMTVGAVCHRLPLLRHVWQLDAESLPQLVETGRGVPEV